LRDVLDVLADLGIVEAFVIAGDAKEPAGPFEGAAALLREMLEIGHQLQDIGIAGYPESHAFISDSTTIQAMSEKVRTRPTSSRRSVTTPPSRERGSRRCGIAA